ncbi:MAG: hypothetical protein JWQ87_4654 [Candidatus Sulfotelmatobacter sp.]|nr:hypothetical protein [Candidatus Sulfotelmatobacter sp.]
MVTKAPELTKLSAWSGPGAALSAVFSIAAVCARASEATWHRAKVNMLSARMYDFMGVFRS